MKNWEQVIINTSLSIKEAIKFIDNKGERIALVTDENQRLLGTITDGDIRRGLINGVELSSTCDKIMCVEPISAKVGVSKNQLRAMFDEHQILHIPILDDEGVLFGLETLQEYIHTDRRIDNPVFLMAGGFGSRLKPLTDNCPKPLLKIGDKPILELIMESFIKAGFHNFYISTHYMPEMIRGHFGDGKQWGVSINYIHEEKPLGTGGALGLLPSSEISLPIILMNGDLLTNVNFIELLEFHNQNHGLATICVRNFDYQIPFGVIETEGSTVTSMKEKPTHNYKVNAGIYVLDPLLLIHVETDEYVDMPTLLKRHMDQGEKLLTFPIHEYWLDIGRKEDFIKAQSEVERL